MLNMFISNLNPLDYFHVNKSFAITSNFGSSSSPLYQSLLMIFYACKAIFLVPASF